MERGEKCGVQCALSTKPVHIQSAQKRHQLEWNKARNAVVCSSTLTSSFYLSSRSQVGVEEAL